MLRGLFITGTDTGVGKTMVAAALMRRYRVRGQLCYWKPIQTGTENDTAAVRAFGECSEDEIFDRGVRLPSPVSPHLAAALAGRPIEIDDLVSATGGWDAGRRWLVEGAGGVLVPINERELMTDLMRKLGLPLLVVARSTLGTINHTLLTLEALRHRALRVAGVVMTGDPNPENRRAIEQFGDVPVLGEMPRLVPLTPAALGRWAVSDLDRAGILSEYVGQ